LLRTLGVVVGEKKDILEWKSELEVELVELPMLGMFNPLNDLIIYCPFNFSIYDFYFCEIFRFIIGL